jgi:hypothetical protein
MRGSLGSARKRKERTRLNHQPPGWQKEGTQMITISILAVTLLAGALAGAIAMLRAGIAREESDKSLLGKPVTRASALTRWIVDLHTEPIP